MSLRIEISSGSSEDNSARLFNIPLVGWVRGTIERMNAIGKDDLRTWTCCWFETYKNLGGQGVHSGAKACPKRAAYGLWRLGRISNCEMAFQNWALCRVNQEFGKNATYAVLALDSLETEGHRSKAELWCRVRELYQQKLGERPAQSEQGAVTVALGLFTEKQTVAVPR